MNLVAGFPSLGTILSVGLMILPAAAARFWVGKCPVQCALPIGIGPAAAGGLPLPFGPAIIPSAGAIHAFSVLAGSRGLLRPVRPRRHHRTA